MSREANLLRVRLMALFFVLSGILGSAYSQSTLLWSQDFRVGLPQYYFNQPSIETDSDTIRVIGAINTASGQRLAIVKYELNGTVISTKLYGKDSVYNNSLIDYKFDSFGNVYLLQKEKLGYFKSKIVFQKYSLTGGLTWVKQITPRGHLIYPNSYRPGQ